MSPVSGSTTAGRVYLDLKNRARDEGRATGEIIQLYVLEGFLTRLEASEHRTKFVLKGGVLLAAFGNRRPTRDVDLQAEVSNNADEVLTLIRGICARDMDDGLVFDWDGASVQTIRDEDQYSGVRVTMGVALATARHRFHVDVNVGDPVWPAPRIVRVPRLLGGPAMVLSGYPLHMVHAEKLVTAVQRGAANTRWRDFGDVWELSGSAEVNGSDLVTAIKEVAAYRNAKMSPLREVLAGYPEIAQARYRPWRRKQQLDNLPEQFAELLEGVFEFAEPALIGTAHGTSWDPASRLWR